MSSPHINDVGTVFKLRIKDQDGNVLSLLGASTLHIILTRPDGTDVVKTASLTTDGTDGLIQYSTVLGDLNQSGPWKIQGYVALPSWSGHTDVSKFKVLANLD